MRAPKLRDKQDLILIFHLIILSQYYEACVI